MFKKPDVGKDELIKKTHSPSKKNIDDKSDAPPARKKTPKKMKVNRT